MRQSDIIRRQNHGKVNLVNVVSLFSILFIPLLVVVSLQLNTSLNPALADSILTGMRISSSRVPLELF